MVLLGKIMILQGVGHPISCLGVCYANDPKKGGYTTPAAALDLTTSLRGDFIIFHYDGRGGDPSSYGCQPFEYIPGEVKGCSGLWKGEIFGVTLSPNTCSAREILIWVGGGGGRISEFPSKF